MVDFLYVYKNVGQNILYYHQAHKMSDIMSNYLRHQSEQVLIQQQPQQSSHARDLVVRENESMSLEEFKECVKRYMELDNWLKKAQDVMKEKKKQKMALSEMITKFMIRYDIDDLNSKFGKISCKTKQVKAPISQRTIKDKITEYYKDNTNDCSQLMKVVFDDRPVVEKTSLRRVRIT